MLETRARTGFSDEQELFRAQVRRFLEREFHPYAQAWEQQGIVPRSFWKAAGSAGLLCPDLPERYGGYGLDFRFNAIVNEELSYAGAADTITLQSDVISGYVFRYGSEAMKDAILPGMISGDIISAVAMTEPGAGSDLQNLRTTAKREGDEFVVNGSKTYITNGQNADVVVTAVKTDLHAGAKGLSLLLLEADRPGFTRGRNLDKIGQHSADTSELFFNDLRVPATNLIGELNQGFKYLVSDLAQERLSIAISAQAAAQRAFDEALEFTKHRAAFGSTVFKLQNTRFTLADMAAKLQVGWAHLDWAIERLVRRELTSAEAASAKLFHSEMQWSVMDAALQLHGGAGYMNEYPIARLWRDARVRRIYGGTSEIMKEVIGRSL